MKVEERVGMKQEAPMFHALNHFQENKGTTSNFSIDHILNCAGRGTCHPVGGSLASSAPRSSSDGDQFIISCPQEHLMGSRDIQQVTFQWLNCTRYQPPKLPRQRKEVAKRQPGRHPRIPFTMIQLETLEKSYKNAPYLCPDEIIKLSNLLGLSDTRIKIWFQNRRAREKREKDGALVNDTLMNIYDRSS